MLSQSSDWAIALRHTSHDGALVTLRVPTDIDVAGVSARVDRAHLLRRVDDRARALGESRERERENGRGC